MPEIDLMTGGQVGTELLRVYPRVKTRAELGHSTSQPSVSLLPWLRKRVQWAADTATQCLAAVP